MKRKLKFRYGLGTVARIALPLWSAGWLVILVYMLYFGEISAEAKGGALTYHRDDDPFWYWGTAFVTVAMFIFGLAMTFEIEKERGDAKLDDD